MARGGPQPGSGRPKGSKNQATLDREKVLAAIKQRIMRKADRILDAQFQLGTGCSFLYRVDKDEKGNRQKPVMVTSPEEISAFLTENEDSGEVEGSFYYITTVKPDGYALDSMLNRAFGKPPQIQEIGGPDGGAITLEVTITRVNT